MKYIELGEIDILLLFLENCWETVVLEYAKKLYGEI